MEGSKESCEMVRDVFQEVIEILYKYHQVSYHVFCSVGNERWSENSLIRFTVYFWNDQNGSEWEEEWYIDEEGIHTEEKLFKTLEEFKTYW